MKRPATLLYSVNEKVPLLTGGIITLQHSVILIISLLTPTLVINLAFGSAPKIAAALTEVSMLAMALGCFLLALRHKYFGCGYLCPAVCDSSYMIMSILALNAGGIPLLMGMNIFAGFIILGFAGSLQFIHKLMPPEVTGICILMIGISILTPTMQSSLGALEGSQFHFNNAETLTFLITFALTVMIAIWGGNMLSRFNLVIAFVIGDCLSYYFHLFDKNLLVILHQHRVISFPHLGFSEHYQFSLSLVIPFVAAAFSSSMKTMGNIACAQRINDTEWLAPNFQTIRGGLFIQGFLMILSGLLGGLGLGTSASNVGISEATRITSRYINITLAAFLFILAFFPQALYSIICTPAPVRGAILLYAVCFMIVSGLKMIVTRNFNMRRIMVVSISFCLGLVVHFVPGFSHVFPPILRPIFNSSLSTATLAAFFLNLLFRLGSSHTTTQQINLQSHFEPKICEYFHEQCQAWGVQRKTVQDAEHAMLYCLEALQQLASYNMLEMQIKYDEYDLDFIFNYRGNAPDLINKSTSGPINFLDKSAILITALTLLQIYAQHLQSKTDQDQVTLSFSVAG